MSPGSPRESRVSRTDSYHNLAQSVQSFQQNYATSLSTWNRPQRDVESEATALFVHHPVAEIRTMETGIKRDIEKKKQELRMMVGERYRELIEAADSITAMKASIRQVNQQFQDMREMTTAKHLSAVAKINDTSGSAEAEERKTKMYRVACQIKLLVDTPEQIWHALESSKYLVACRLFLIARQIFNNLQSRNDKDLKVLQQFPVVQKQWDAISHFRSQILDGSRNFMKQGDLTAHVLGETLCAVILLQRITPLQAFEEFLDARKAVIVNLLGGVKTPSLQVSEIICSAMAIWQSTIDLINQTFIGNSEPSLLEKYLSNLGKHFSIATPGAAKVESSVAGLYSSKTNFHSISRFLPDSIHRFTPYINYGESGPKTLSPEQITHLAKAWLVTVKAETQSRGQEVLSLVDKAQALAKVRADAWQVLQITPTATTNPEWEQTCKTVFGQSFCIWRDVFRDLFNARSQEIVKAAFLTLLQLPAQILAPALAHLENQVEERNIGKYVWSEQDDKSAKVTADRSLAFTPAVVRVQSAVDELLQLIKSDVDHIFSFGGKPVPENLEQDVYSIYADSLTLRSALQRSCVDTVIEFKALLEKYLQDLHNVLESGDEAILDTQRPLIFEKMLFIGRVARCISTRPKNLHLVLQLSSQSPADASKARRQFLTGLKGQKSESETVLEKLQQSFAEVYVASHSDWLRWLADSSAKFISEGLSTANWKDASKKLASWEAVAMEDEGEKGEAQTFIKLPVQTSVFISEALFFLVREVHRQCGHTLDKAVVRFLLLEVTQRVLSLYQDFAKSRLGSGDAVSDKGAVQLLFDLLFLSKVLAGSWEGSPNLGDHQASFGRLMVSVKARIDPIDLAIYEIHVGKHVNRHYSRSVVLFGVLTSLNEPLLEGKRAPSLKEQHNLLSLAPQAKRFTFLPISDHGASLALQKTVDANSFSQLTADGTPQARFVRSPIRVNLGLDNPLAKQKKFDGIAEMALQKGPSFLRGVWSGFGGVFGTQESPASPGFS